MNRSICMGFMMTHAKQRIWWSLRPFKLQWTRLTVSATDRQHLNNFMIYRKSMAFISICINLQAIKTVSEMRSNLINDIFFKGTHTLLSIKWIRDCCRRRHHCCCCSSANESVVILEKSKSPKRITKWPIKLIDNEHFVRTIRSQ